jgi:type IV secretion system protein VirB8
MRPDAKLAAESYFADARSWAEDARDAARRSQRIAWTVALIACAVVLLEALAIFMLLPLKTIVPYTLLVDRQTGYVQKLNPIEQQTIAPDRALTQSFLVQYVLAREGFDRATVQQDYRKALLWSAETARSDYAASMPISNPQSPLVRLPGGATVEARARSVSTLGPRSALVRFETVFRDKGGTAQPSQSWVALIDYRFSTAPLSVEDRYLNPLGFQVTRYRRSAEAPPIAASDEPSTPSDIDGASVRPRLSAQPLAPGSAEASASPRIAP